MNKRSFPSCGETQKVLADLTGSEIRVRSMSQSEQTASQGVGYLGSFCSANNEIRALIGTDLKLSASLAALLTRFMSGVAKEAIDSGELDETLHSNLFEVINVLGGKLNAENVEHVRFINIHHINKLPETFSSFLNDSQVQRVDYQITVPSYYDGVLSYYIHSA
ncbi:hypothetical protein [Legionella sp. CNM-4043-24]|uniref:hypothetical protein n=1 Tax=Legionella sp. CNM-4043-24 TaxID=3421646 RepID=UPI00403AB401